MLLIVPLKCSAHQAGWPCVILSDLLTLRVYSDPKAWALPEVPPPAQLRTSTGPTGPITVERAEGLVRLFHLVMPSFTLTLIIENYYRRTNNSL
jgi:hypothetical protein